MISIREIDYDTDESTETVFSRLTWRIEKVDGLAGELINHYTVATNRPWVGVYDTEKMEFGLIEPRGFFSGNFFQVVVRGRVIKKNGKTIINIRLRLGVYTFLNFLMIYLFTLSMAGGLIMDPGKIINAEIDGVIAGIMWILVFPVLGTLMVNLKLNKIETKVENLFGLQ